jgi:hypothetical protein
MFVFKQTFNEGQDISNGNVVVIRKGTRKACLRRHLLIHVLRYGRSRPMKIEADINKEDRPKKSSMVRHSIEEEGLLEIEKDCSRWRKKKLIWAGKCDILKPARALTKLGTRLHQPCT